GGAAIVKEYDDLASRIRDGWPRIGVEFPCTRVRTRGTVTTAPLVGPLFKLAASWASSSSPAPRGTENAYRGRCTVDTTTGGRAYVTCTRLRPRVPHGPRSGRRDRLLRGVGPGGRGQDVRRGRVLGHGLRHSRLPHRDRHAEAA